MTLAQHAATSSCICLQIQRDKNQPSIILWSCGNESSIGQAHYTMADYYRKLDPSRPTHYEVHKDFGSVQCSMLHVVVLVCVKYDGAMEAKLSMCLQLYQRCDVCCL